MKRKGILFFILVAFFISATGSSSAQPLAGNFVANLSGDEEVPPVATLARGQTFFQLNQNGTELDFRLNIANIENVTQSHIHCGAAGVNGPVVVFLFGFIPGGVTLNGILAQGTVNGGDVIATPDSAICPGGIADFDDLLDQMRNGNTYVNVHTTAFPGGEIRGQIMPAGRPAP